VAFIDWPTSGVTAGKIDGHTRKFPRKNLGGRRCSFDEAALTAPTCCSVIRWQPPNQADNWATMAAVSIQTHSRLMMPSRVPQMCSSRNTFRCAAPTGRNR
jgi:hypothetical protein